MNDQMKLKTTVEEKSNYTLLVPFWYLKKMLRACSSDIEEQLRSGDEITVGIYEGGIEVKWRRAKERRVRDIMPVSTRFPSVGGTPCPTCKGKGRFTYGVNPTICHVCVGTGFL